LEDRPPEQAEEITVAMPEHRAEDRPVDGTEPRETRDEPDAVGNETAIGRWLDGALVFPQALREQRRTLEEPPAGIDLHEGDIVILQRKNATEEKPAPGEGLAGLPASRDVVHVGWKRHAKQRSELAVYA
jgi:hypothetical protein